MDIVNNRFYEADCILIFIDTAPHAINTPCHLGDFSISFAIESPKKSKNYKRARCYDYRRHGIDYKV